MDICNEHFHILSHKFKWRLIICSSFPFPALRIALCSSSVPSARNCVCVACRCLYNGLMMAQWQAKNIAHIHTYTHTIVEQKEREKRESGWSSLVISIKYVILLACSLARALFYHVVLVLMYFIIGFIHKMHSKTLCLSSHTVESHLDDIVIPWFTNSNTHTHICKISYGDWHSIYFVCIWKRTRSEIIWKAERRLRRWEQNCNCILIQEHILICLLNHVLICYAVGFSVKILYCCSNAYMRMTTLYLFLQMCAYTWMCKWIDTLHIKVCIKIMWWTCTRSPPHTHAHAHAQAQAHSF